MKKLRLKALSLGAREILSREQLKSISGGTTCLGGEDCALGEYCDRHDSNPGVCVTADTGGSGSGQPNGSSPSCGQVWNDSTKQYEQGCPQVDASGVFMGCIVCD